MFYQIASFSDKIFFKDRFLALGHLLLQNDTNIVGNKLLSHLKF